MVDMFYLMPGHLRHYQYMIDNGYKHEIVQLPSQKYIVFKFPEDVTIGIAWPTTTDKIDHIGDDPITFGVDIQLGQAILKELKDPSYHALLHPILK